MKKNSFKYIFLFLILSLGLNSCGDDDSSPDLDFVSLYGGDPYMGDAVGEIYIDGNLRYTWDGSATASVYEAKADSVSIAFLADFDDGSEVNFKIRGIYNHLSFSFIDGETTNFSVNQGIIDGDMSTPEHAMLFSGTIDKEAMQIMMELEYLKDGDFPAGSILKVVYNTARALEDGTDTEGCSMRLVPVWSPNGVTMGMVPDC